MFCRSCHYDLQGQTVFRCPECGQDFDPQQGNTYFSRLPRLRDRLLRCHWRIAVPALLTLVLASWYVVVLSASRCRETSFSIVSMRNLKSILTPWVLDHFRRGREAARDPTMLVEQLPPAPSAYSDRPTWEKRLRLSRAVQDYAWPLVLPIPFYAAAMSLCFRARRRRFVLGATVAAVLVLAVSAQHSAIAALIYPGTLAYVRDYGYVKGLDWSVEVNRSNRLAAYERQPIDPARRVVGFMDGRTTRLPEAVFRRLAADQAVRIESATETSSAP